MTVASWSTGRFEGRAVAPYIAVQCVGAVAAALILRWLLRPVGGLGATVPSLSLDRAFVVEAGYSAIFAFVIFGVATDPRVPRSVPPFAIGAVVAAGALATGPLTGGSVNPARTLGLAVAGGDFMAHWLDWLALIVGMLVGAHTYGRLPLAHTPERDADEVPLGVDGPI